MIWVNRPVYSTAIIVVVVVVAVWPTIGTTLFPSTGVRYSHFNGRSIFSAYAWLLSSWLPLTTLLIRAPCSCSATCLQDKLPRSLVDSPREDNKASCSQICSDVHMTSRLARPPLSLSETLLNPRRLYGVLQLHHGIGRSSHSPRSSTLAHPRVYSIRSK